MFKNRTFKRVLVGFFVLGASVAGFAAAPAVSRAAGSWTSMCQDSGHPDYIGPVRSTREAADKDCDAHRAKYSGHNCVVTGSD